MYTQIDTHLYNYENIKKNFFVVIYGILYVDYIGEEKID